MNSKRLVDAQDLQDLGFPKKTSIDIIKEAKQDLVKSGYHIYDNIMIKQVPAYAVERLVGFVFPDGYFQSVDEDKIQREKEIDYINDLELTKRQEKDLAERENRGQK